MHLHLFGTRGGGGGGGSAEFMTHVVLRALMQIFPHRSTVTKGLAPCLDDKKRLVRKEAAKARSDWFLLGAL